MQKALDLLRKRGEAKAGERSTRTTGQGVVCSYIHNNNRLGVLLQLGCETDFVARNEVFQALARDIAMQVAATNPITVLPEEVPHELVEKEREIWKEQLKREGKKEQMFEKILEGKEKKYREELSLMKQQFVKNPEVSVEQVLKDAITKMGENIKVVRFSRFSL